MSNIFREYLKTVGSGTHTGKDLSRQEAKAATRMMLLQEATPAQIGAFMIAHRIKRPTPEELAGMLDAYDELGPQLSCRLEKTVTVLSNPYDGRSRTVPVTAITALILAAADVPVVMHGGDRMPTKYGIPSVDIWQGLGVNFAHSLPQAQRLLETVKISFVYLPQQFPLANDLVPYRDQIGKRPPFATLELVWSPYRDAHIVSGFVHPPTEERLRETLALRDTHHFTMVKGLEGSCDLARNRTGIVGLQRPNASYERLHLNPQDYGFYGSDVTIESTAQVIEQTRAVLQGKPCDLMPAAVLNGGFYLWCCGVCAKLEEGFAQAETMLTKGEVRQKLQELSAASQLSTVKI